ncbi:MAG TPA: DsbA family protein [Catalimonadaceae bacterium]|nr:DsbA family protein [Catalimonadaceae bacterium]
MKSTKPTIICVFDPLCGWCFGFGPVLIRLQETYKDELEFDVISGGMITGNRVGPLSNMSSFIKQAYQQVENHTGIRFGQKYIDETLEKGTATNSSLEPASMLTLFKRYQREKAVEFSHEIQKLLFIEGIDPVDMKAYIPLFEKYGFKREEIEPQLTLKDLQQETILEFQRAQNWNITGFPTCVLQAPDGKAYGLNRGYESFESLSLKIDKMLGKG